MIRLNDTFGEGKAEPGQRYLATGGWLKGRAGEITYVGSMGCRLEFQYDHGRAYEIFVGRAPSSSVDMSMGDFVLLNSRN